MSRLFLLRFSFLSLKTYINTKFNFIINLSIFVIIFALTASGISIIFENRVEKLETSIIKNEVNQIIYSKWINKTPRIIKKINNVYQNRKDQVLFSSLIRSYPDDDNLETSLIYNNRDRYVIFSFFLEDVISDNFRDINLALTDAILLASNSFEINKIKEKKNFLNKLIFEYDEILNERNKHLDNEKGNNYEDLQKHNQKYSVFIEKYDVILEKQKSFFINFVREFFLEKRKFFTGKNSNDLSEITDLASLETKFILFAFIIQFIIFIILQIFEVSIERSRKK